LIVARPYTQEESTGLKKLYIAEFKLNGGYIHSAANAIGVPVATIRYWTLHDNEFKKECDLIKELVLDRAEQELFYRATKVRDRDTALLFFLKTKGKERGYIERVENVNTTMAEVDYRTNQIDVDLVERLEAQGVEKYKQSLANHETAND